MQVNTFNFLRFEMKKEQKYSKKKKPANFSKRAEKAGVEFSSELIYALQFSQHLKATKLTPHET